MPNLLPPEITDQIIDHLHDDNVALRACSLTARMFSPSAQYHLFSGVALVLTYTSVRAKEFLEFLDHTPRLASVVRDLSIEQRSVRPGLPVEALLPITARRLPRVTTLRLSWFNFRTEPVRQAFAQPAQYFSNIRRLSVEFSSFDTFEDFTVFLAAHPKVEELELRNVSWKNSAVGGAACLQPRPALKKLVWSEVTSARPLVDWVCTLPPHTINSMGNLSITLAEAPSTARLLHHLGPDLHHLQLGITTAYLTEISPSGIAKIISITSNTALRTLCFDLSLPMARHASWGAAWVLVTLSQVTSRALEGVIFRTGDYVAEKFPDSLPFDGIDELLSTSDVFENLRTVKFVLCCGEYSQKSSKQLDRDNEWIRAKLGKLNKRGILTFA